MAGQTRTTFKKRQKEMARMEKQRDKAAKRLERKQNPKPAGESDLLMIDEFGNLVEVTGFGHNASFTGSE